jgi:hypothetical protein
MRIILFLLLVLFHEVKADEMHSYFLSCTGYNYLIESENEFKLHKLEKITKTYEIRDKNLYIAIPHGKGVLINPTDY